MKKNGLLLLLCGLSAGASETIDEEDASDPTKVYTFAGAGLKYTDYTNGDSMYELRASGKTWPLSNS